MAQGVLADQLSSTDFDVENLDEERPDLPSDADGAEVTRVRV